MIYFTDSPFERMMLQRPRIAPGPLQQSCLKYSKIFSILFSD